MRVIIWHSSACGAGSHYHFGKDRRASIEYRLMELIYYFFCFFLISLIRNQTIFLRSTQIAQRRVARLMVFLPVQLLRISVANQEDLIVVSGRD